LKLHLALASANHDPDETYEQSLKYVSESDPRQTEASAPWEKMEEEVQNEGREEDDKWKRVKQVTEPKKPVRKLVKGRRQPDSDSEDDFGEEAITATQGGGALSKPGLVVLASVLLDSDDE
jgi:hypothetical protein